VAHAFKEGAGAAAASRFNAYIQNIAHALMRGGMEESHAIATALNATRRWASGDTGTGRGHVHPEVRQASRAALEEWEKLKETHH